MTTPRTDMVRLENLTKRFGRSTAIQGISLQIAQGEIFGLLGHNGAGKSTTFGILLGMVAADEGRAWVGGACVRDQRAQALARVGAIFETPCFYDYLSGWHNLTFLVSLSGQSIASTQASHVISLVGLQDRIHDPVRTYSHGMRQRLALAQALLPTPEVLILDEPTDGLDPLGIQEMRTLIRSLRSEFGMTVLLSSHLLSEVEHLCDRVAIIHEGRLIFCGTWDAGPPRWKFEGDPASVLAETLQGLGLRHDGAAWESVGEFDPADAVEALVKAGVRVRSVERTRATLEDFYMRSLPK